MHTYTHTHTNTNTYTQFLAVREQQVEALEEKLEEARSPASSLLLTKALQQRMHRNGRSAFIYKHYE
jgi:predicted transcriptional regulator